MRIGTVLPALFALMLLLTVSALMLPIVGDVQQRVDGQAASRDARAARAVFAALQVLRVERGPTRSTLERTDPASADFIANTSELRAKSEIALATVLRECAITDCVGTEREILAGLSASIDKVVTIRKEVDAAFRVLLSDRRPSISRDFNAASTDLIDRLEEMFNVLGDKVRTFDAETAELIEIRQLAWLARDGIGLERNFLSEGLIANGLSSAAQKRVTELHAQAEVTWPVVRRLAARAGVPEDISEIVRAAHEEAFEKYGKMRESVYQALISGQPPRISSDGLIRSSNTALDRLAEVSNVALAVAERHVVLKVDEATHGLVLHGVLLVLALLVGFAGFSIVVRRVTRPIAGLTAGMRQLADGKFDVVLPGFGRKDEIGDIAAAVETFKVKAAEKSQLEADAQQRRQNAESQAQTTAAEQQAKAAEQRDRAAEEQARVVQSLAQGLKSLADGDLTFRLTDGFTDAYRQIMEDFNTAMSRLQETIQAIAGAACEVASASVEISTGTTDLSQRTEEQAASLEETSASMEQISSTVKRNADNAQQAKQFAEGTREVADRGGQVVAEAVGAMSRIEESSRKVADIITVIDEIARQTNLLALNAAVEAARAGEAGRGFAVVASEVRSLAQRSSQAAKNIKDLITNSSGQVKEGVHLVNKAGAALSDIVESIKKVADIVSGIAAASTEQSTGIDHVNTALSQMDGVTQQNSALVEQNAAAAKTLEGQSRAMDQSVRFFRLGAADAAPVVSLMRVATDATHRRPAKWPARATPARRGGGPVGGM
jgi:methyl-accepting chemotaxis protein